MIKYKDYLIPGNERTWKTIRSGDFVWLTNANHFYGVYHRAFVLEVDTNSWIRVIIFSDFGGREMIRQNVYGPDTKFALISRVEGT